jgi:uncharacterized sulfatase
MTREKFICLTPVLMFSPAAVTAQTADRQAGQTPPRPNIVAIVADDLLTSELSCYGGVNISTPNIDRLAREGIQFSNAYASMSMSVPIRASMYTGLFPARHGSYQNHKPTFKGTKTVNDYMPEEGYRVGRTGKNHPGPQPLYAFDQIPGFTVNCVSPTADFSVDGIREWVTRSDDPFLLYVCSIHPHVPWTWGDPGEFDPDKLVLPPNYVDSPATRRIFTKYLAEVRALDNEVGAVLDMLTETGKLDETIVIFLGEQGPQFPGGKWTSWYPGVHSALLARYPSRIEAGTDTDAIVQYEDLLPTFLDIAGGEPRAELDGVSFLDVLYGKRDKARKWAYFLHNNIPEGRAYPIRAIRDDRYALILNLTPEAEYHEKHVMRENSDSGVWESWMAAVPGDPEATRLVDRYLHRPAVEFYDLKRDNWELRNLADEPRHKKRIERMRRELMSWMESQGDTGAAMDVGNWQ